MSRLIIKNLPPYLPPDALRKHFTVQALKNAASTSSSSRTFTLRRQIYSQTGDFVGFETKGAEEAKKWFDKSFIDSMRVTIEVVNVSSLRLKPNAYVFGVFRS